MKEFIWIGLTTGAALLLSAELTGLSVKLEQEIRKRESREVIEANIAANVRRRVSAGDATARFTGVTGKNVRPDM